MQPHTVTKTIVSISEMARMVGLSKTRFYQLIKSGAFPEPERDPETNRPFYGEENQRAILAVRQRNCGINGRPVLFYARRRDAGAPRSSPKATVRSRKQQNPHADLMAGLGELGVTASLDQVVPIVQELFPAGTEGVAAGEVIKRVFLRIRSQNRTDTHER
jgi:hypothetical protein